MGRPADVGATLDRCLYGSLATARRGREFHRSDRSPYGPRSVRRDAGAAFIFRRATSLAEHRRAPNLLRCDSRSWSLRRDCRSCRRKSNLIFYSTPWRASALRSRSARNAPSSWCTRSRNTCVRQCRCYDPTGTHHPQPSLSNLKSAGAIWTSWRCVLGSRLSVVVDLEPVLGQTRYPPLLLLSLVENAVTHGR